MKKTISYIIILIIILVVGYLYITRSPSAPSQDIEKAAGGLEIPEGNLYRISQAKSEASFSIGEILNDKPFTAVGTTSQIAGDIAISEDTITIGTIAINARTFKTDNERRDGAISRAILKAEDPANEFIYFSPNPVENLPIPTDADSTLAFKVSGNLTISGVTKPAVFDVQMMISENQVSGKATTTIKRSDFGLVIPNVPFVASVNDEFVVGAEIVADKI